MRTSRTTKSLTFLGLWVSFLSRQIKMWAPQYLMRMLNQRMSVPSSLSVHPCTCSSWVSSHNKSFPRSMADTVLTFRNLVLIINPNQPGGAYKPTSVSKNYSSGTKCLIDLRTGCKFQFFRCPEV